MGKQVPDFRDGMRERKKLKTESSNYIVYPEVESASVRERDETPAARRGVGGPHSPGAITQCIFFLRMLFTCFSSTCAQETVRP